MGGLEKLIQIKEVPHDIWTSRLTDQLGPEWPSENCQTIDRKNPVQLVRLVFLFIASRVFGSMYGATTNKVGPNLFSPDGAALMKFHHWEKLPFCNAHTNCPNFFFVIM